MAWCQYRKKRGTLNLGLRMDRGFALVTMFQANPARDKKLKPEPFTLFDFTPYEDEPPVSMAKAMETWK